MIKTKKAYELFEEEESGELDVLVYCGSCYYEFLAREAGGIYATICRECQQTEPSHSFWRKMPEA